jgi:CheY-like chemotaxis protein
MVQQSDYALVLMDIQMPVLDGLKATRHIRALAAQSGGERFATLPIIAMTALAMPQDEVNIREAGMTNHITKPVNPEQLAMELAKWLPIGKPIPEAPRTDQASMGPLPADFSTVPSANIPNGIRSRIGNHVEASHKQLQKVRTYYLTAADNLQRLIEEQGLAASEAFCHDLIGTSGFFGAPHVHAYALEIQGLLKEGKVPELAQFERLRHQLQEVIAEIDGLGVSEKIPHRDSL